MSCVGLYDHLDDGLERHTRQIFTAELLKLWSIQSKLALSPKLVRSCCPTAVYFSTEKTVSKWMFRSFFVLCCCCPPQCNTTLNLLLSSLCSLAKSGLSSWHYQSEWQQQREMAVQRHQCAASFRRQSHLMLLTPSICEQRLSFQKSMKCVVKLLTVADTEVCFWGNSRPT